MGFRNIIISSPAKLSIHHTQLKIETDCCHHVPLEDINALLIEHLQVTLSAYALQALAESGVCTFICNTKHIPSAILTGFKSHFHQTRMLQLQLDASKPFKKKLWQHIIKQKITNQARVLELAGRQQDTQLRQRAEMVQSGDAGNLEASAAALYFPALFGDDFIRTYDSAINAALNYGYAIIRGHICRSLVLHGLEASLGLFHRGMTNAFNLADDLIEPYRPLIDLYVYQNREKLEVELSSTVKHELFALVNMDMQLDGERQPLHYAVKRTVQSLAKALKSDTPTILLPSIVPLEHHQYE